MSKKNKNKNKNKNNKKDLTKSTDNAVKKEETAKFIIDTPDRIEPAHAATSKKGSKDASKGEELKGASPAKLIITLTVICAAVALLLAVVNHFTKAQIDDNNEKATLASIRDIFDDSVEAESIDVPDGTGFTSLYIVKKGGGVCGYSASVSPAGFGGPINLMVGIDSIGEVVGVDIVSLSETPGLGSKVGGDSFLSQFAGSSGNITVDAISGATISSTAVGEGVNSVTTNLLDLVAIAGERGLQVVPYVRDSVVKVTTTATTAVPETSIAVTTAAPAVSEDKSGAPDVTKVDTPPEVIVQNPGDGKTNINAEYVEDTTEYETITTEPESSDLETTAE